jgi:hypothetical protein
VDIDTPHKAMTTSEDSQHSSSSFANVLITAVMFVSLIALIAVVIYAVRTHPTPHTLTMTNPTIDIENASRTPIITVNGVLKPTY